MKNVESLELPWATKGMLKMSKTKLSIHPNQVATCANIVARDFDKVTPLVADWIVC